jgi:8-oxo-dGTP pyrophosphatase MutT (NUDIX family)
VARPHTRGVKCVVREGDAVLFVRHAYGDRRVWELPGGGVRRGEEPSVAAAREAREELGIALADWRELGTVHARGYGKRTTLTCFERRPDGREIVLDEGELQEARWCDLDRPPQPLGTDARVVLGELLGART